MAASAALHVGRAAAVQHAVADGGHEGVGLPLLERAGGHDVRVAGEAEHRAAAAARRPEVVDDAVAQALDLEAGARRGAGS